MNNSIQMLIRQAQWQKSRQSLSWPEKIRLAEQALEVVRKWGPRDRPILKKRADIPAEEVLSPPA